MIQGSKQMKFNPGLDRGKDLNPASQKGITTLYSLTENGQLKDFRHVRERYSLKKIIFFQIPPITQPF